jgi:hypothetical protein
MNNKLSTLLAVSAIGLSLAAMSASAADTETLHVNVPFSFTAGKTTMPAGAYTVYENEAHLVMIRGAKGAVLLLGTPGSESVEEKNALSFERTSKGVELRTIHAAGRATSVVPAVLNEK